MATAPVVPAKKAGWKAPPRKYFGPKDPETGERLDEPVYEHYDYPKTLYHPHAEPITVASEDEHAALDKEWRETPYGDETHPSAETVLARKVAAASAKTGKGSGK